MYVGRSKAVLHFRCGWQKGRKKSDLKSLLPGLEETEIYEIVSDITSGVHLGAADNLTKRTTEKRHVIRKLPFGYTQEIYLASFHLLKTQRAISFEIQELISSYLEWLWIEAKTVVKEHWWDSNQRPCTLPFLNQLFNSWQWINVFCLRISRYIFWWPYVWL